MRRKGLGRRMLTRVLPGSVAVVAALTLPEFSVGAGDISRDAGLNDPPEPTPAKGQGMAKPGQAAAKPGLAGVRYAAMVDLDLGAPQMAALPLAAVVPVALPQSVAGTRFAEEFLPAASAPVSAPAAPAFVPPLPAEAPLAAPAVRVIETSEPASLPVEPTANVAVAPEVVPAAAPAVMAPAAEAPSLPRIEAVQAVPVPPVIAPQPAAAPAALPAPEVPAAPAAVAAVAAPRPVIAGQPGGRGAIEQLTPARIAAAQSAPQSAPQPSAPSAPAPKPAAAAPVTPVAAKVAVAAPGVRAPISPPAPAAAPARPAPSPAPASRPAPVPAAAVVAAPKPKPAMAAPPSAASSPVPLAVTARLVTRVDGKASGAVDFQQTSAGLKVRLGSIAEVLSDRFDPAQLARIRGSAAGNAYLSLAELQAQGIPISYDPVYDEFNVGLTDTRPKAARKVHMDQISAPERGASAAAMDQVRR